MKVRVWVGLLLFIALCIPNVTSAQTFQFQGAVGLQGFLPQKEGIGDVYSVGAGPNVEARVNFMQAVLLSLSVSPSYGFGTPDSGPLAANPSGSLWSVPFLATLQVPFLSKGPYRPYAGAGIGVHYVRESLSFESGIGSRTATKTASEFGWQVMAGVEQNKPARFYGELWFLKAEYGAAGSAIPGRKIGGWQLRVGYRRGL